MRKPKQRKPNDLSRSLVGLEADRTLIAVIEMSLSSWLAAGIVLGVKRQPLKKLKTDASRTPALICHAVGLAVKPVGEPDTGNR